SGLGFYKYSGTSLAANKAYLPGTAVGAREFYLFDFDDETSTGVNDVRSKVTEGRGEYFNLSGLRVSKPTKGLYIVNSKKVVVK
nr:hypothetical protein [Prevotella sp.]